MDGKPRGSLAPMGGQRVLAGLHPPPPVPHEGQRHLRDGKRRVRGTRTRLRGRHLVGAPRGTPAKRLVIINSI